MDRLEHPSHASAAQLFQQRILAERAVPVLLLGGQDSRLAEGLVCDFVRPSAHPVRRLQHAGPLPQPLGKVRRVTAQLLHARLVPLFAQLLPAVEQVVELVFCIGGHGRPAKRLSENLLKPVTPSPTTADSANGHA